MKRKNLVFGLISMALLGGMIFTIPAKAGAFKTKAIQVGNGRYGMADGSFADAKFRNPYSDVKRDSYMYVTDTGNNCVRVVDLMFKKVSTLTGSLYFARSYKDALGYKDGVLQEAQFNSPKGIDIDKNGCIYIADSGNNVIRFIKDTYVLTLAGSGIAGYENGDVTVAKFNHPTDVAIMDRDLYVADTFNRAIRKIDSEGNVMTIVKGGELIEPTGLYVKNSALYIVDSGAQAIFKQTNKGLKRIAGAKTGKDKKTGYRKSGMKNSKALKSWFNFPKAMVIGSNKEIYVADTWNSAIRKIKSGKVSTEIEIKGRNIPARPSKILTDNKRMIVVDNANNNILIYGK